MFAWGPCHENKSLRGLLARPLGALLAGVVLGDSALSPLCLWKGTGASFFSCAAEAGTKGMGCEAGCFPAEFHPRAPD